MTRLLAYIRVILKWRKLIFYNTLAITLLAVGISFILPQRFTATAQLLPPPEDDPFGMSSILGGGLSSSRLGRLRMGMLGGSTTSDLLVGILQSRTVMEKVVSQCSIIHYYRIKKNSMEEALKALRKMTGISVTDEGIVRISVEAKTPHLAATAANTYASELDYFLRYSSVTRGRNTRIFVERRLRETDSTLRIAQDSLEAFQRRERVATVDEETKAAVDAYARLRSELLVREARLELAANLGSDLNPYVTNLRAEVAAFRSQLRGLESGRPGGGFGVGFGVSFESLPEVAAEYLRRYRDLKVQEESYAMLYEQYEYAKIMEARDTPTVTVLDPAVPPERRSFPKRSLVVIAVMFFGAFAGVCYSFIAEYFARLRETRPEEYSGWRDSGHEVSSVMADAARRLFPNKKQ